MEKQTLTREQLNKVINELPAEVLPDVAYFLEYLQTRISLSSPLPVAEVQTRTASEFLLAIAGLGSAEETDLSERDEEILANEIDPIRGWGLSRNSPE
jgi:hypothetical protein